MAQTQTQNSESLPEEIAQNAGARAAEINHNPAVTDEETKNAGAGEGPNGSGGIAPSTAEDYVPSTSDPEPSDLPSSR